jgi:hypothetical protein
MKPMLHTNRLGSIDRSRRRFLSAATAGVLKDVVMVGGYQETEIDYAG